MSTFQSPVLPRLIARDHPDQCFRFGGFSIKIKKVTEFFIKLFHNIDQFKLVWKHDTPEKVQV